MSDADVCPVLKLQREMRRLERMSDAAHRGRNISAAIANDGRAGVVSCQKDRVAPTTFRGAAVKLVDLAVQLNGNLGSFDYVIDLSVWVPRVLEIKPRARAGRHTVADVVLLRRLTCELRAIGAAFPTASIDLAAQVAEQALGVLGRARLVA